MRPIKIVSFSCWLILMLTIVGCSAERKDTAGAVRHEIAAILDIPYREVQYSRTLKELGFTKQTLQGLVVKLKQKHGERVDSIELSKTVEELIVQVREIEGSSKH